MKHSKDSQARAAAPTLTRVRRTRTIDLLRLPKVGKRIVVGPGKRIELLARPTIDREQTAIQFPWGTGADWQQLELFGSAKSEHRPCGGPVEGVDDHRHNARACNTAISRQIGQRDSTVSPLDPGSSEFKAASTTPSASIGKSTKPPKGGS